MAARDTGALGSDPEGESTFRMFYMKVALLLRPCLAPPKLNINNITCFLYAQVSPCTKKYVHEWTECPFAHPSEKAHRRPPTCHTGIACPEMKRVCLRALCCLIRK